MEEKEVEGESVDKKERRKEKKHREGEEEDSYVGSADKGGGGGRGPWVEVEGRATAPPSLVCSSRG